MYNIISTLIKNEQLNSSYLFFIQNINYIMYCDELAIGSCRQLKEKTD